MSQVKWGEGPGYPVKWGDSPGYQPRICQCGHPEGDHQSNRSAVNPQHVIGRTTWRCPDCGWAHSYDEPMIEVWCVACFRAGRGQDHQCERLVPAADLRGAVDLLIRALDMWAPNPERNEGNRADHNLLAECEAFLANRPGGQ
jgi:hypothetical protein